MAQDIRQLHALYAKYMLHSFWSNYIGRMSRLLPLTRPRPPLFFESLLRTRIVLKVQGSYHNQGVEIQPHKMSLNKNYAQSPSFEDLRVSQMPSSCHLGKESKSARAPIRSKPEDEDEDDVKTCALT